MISNSTSSWYPPILNFTRHCSLTMTLWSSCTQAIRYGCGCFHLLSFNFVTISSDTKLSVLPLSIITSQHLPSHLHLVRNRFLLCSGSFSPLNKTLLLISVSPLSASSECDDLASSSTCATLAWPSFLLSVLPWR